MRAGRDQRRVELHVHRINSFVPRRSPARSHCEIALRNKPVKPFGFTAIVKDENGGQATHLEALGDREVPIDIDAINHKPPAELLGDVFEPRFERAARRAARLVEVEYDRR